MPEIAGGGSVPAEGANLNNDHRALAQEWGKRQAARSPRWQHDKWRRVGLVFGVDVATARPAEEPPPADDRRAA